MSTNAAAAATATLIVAVAGISNPPVPTPEVRTGVSARAGCTVPALAPRDGSSASPAGAQLRPGDQARPTLLDLAARITATQCDAAAGRFEVVHHHLWAYRANGGVDERQVVRWYAADGSGAELATRSRNGQATRDWWQEGDPRVRDLTNAYTSSAWLISSAQVIGRGDDTPALLRGLAALGLWYSPNRQQRTLALQVLAGVHGLTAHWATVDRAGRGGVGLAATSEHGRARDLLILDPKTGQIRAYESSTLTPRGWRVRVYVLLLTRTRSVGRWWEPATSADAASAQRQLLPRQSRVWLIQQEPPCKQTGGDDGAAATSGVAGRAPVGAARPGPQPLALQILPRHFVMAN